jgi:hypothetical protein
VADRHHTFARKALHYSQLQIASSVAPVWRASKTHTSLVLCGLKSHAGDGLNRLESDLLDILLLLEQPLLLKSFYEKQLRQLRVFGWVEEHDFARRARRKNEKTSASLPLRSVLS